MWLLYVRNANAQLQLRLRDPILPIHTYDTTRRQPFASTRGPMLIQEWRLALLGATSFSESSSFYGPEAKENSTATAIAPIVE
ncbi:hypothetical protein ACRALDRAFT_206883 [Sodiomyces alcalophilus JCM 7366]|uniref:uncharacterized protein n=1 Tax=Sodiomyces alcalophilus JCM 7366 TaxID=591952 RepID=UPI0039B64C61